MYKILKRAAVFRYPTLLAFDQAKAKHRGGEANPPPQPLPLYLLYEAAPFCNNSQGLALGVLKTFKYARQSKGRRRVVVEGEPLTLGNSKPPRP